ncbi:MAG: fasciclin domain-containing protein [Planctomycetota bacterium]
MKAINLLHILPLLFALLMPNFVAANDDIVTTAAKNGSFNTLVNLLVAAELDDDLRGKGHFTVFAPTDEAFKHLPKATIEALLKSENAEQLQDILKYHVLTRTLEVPKRNNHPLKSAKTLQGELVRFDREGTKVKVNEANIVTRNIRCSNGIIQVIDAVLMPPKKDNTIVGVASAAGDFKLLLAAAKAAGLAEALGGEQPLTVFAPTDAAFKALPKGKLEKLLKPENKQQLANLLKYHVVSGSFEASKLIGSGQGETLLGNKLAFGIKDGQFQVNGVNVIKNDIATDNGIIHAIDQVLMPPTDYDREITISADWKTPVRRDGIVARKIKIRVTGGGSVRLTNIQAEEIETSIGGGGTAQLEGTVGKHVARVNGGAVLRGKDLVSTNTSINVNGGGIAEVNATKKLTASANAGARISYVDTGAEIEKQINKYAKFQKITH